MDARVCWVSCYVSADDPAGRSVPTSRKALGKATDLPAACNCNHLRRAARRISRYYDLCLAGTGLRSTQYTLLGYLQTEGPMTMVALADLLAMDRATVGHNLRPLQRDGRVEIAVDDKDRRARRVSITAAGRQALVTAYPAWRRAQAGFEMAFGAGHATKMRELLVRAVETPLPDI